MKISIRGDKVKVTDSIKNYIEEKLEKIDKYFDDPSNVEAKVVIKIERDRQKVEITIPLKNFILRAEESQKDVYAAVDMLVDKIERQIRKNKTRLQSQMRKTKDVRDFSVEIIDEIEEEEEEEQFKIVKRKEVEAKPMSEEEAILQMELIGHDFYLFKNQDTMKPTLVYKRKDNQYGIIETI